MAGSESLEEAYPELQPQRMSAGLGPSQRRLQRATTDRHLSMAGSEPLEEAYPELQPQRMSAGLGLSQRRLQRATTDRHLSMAGSESLEEAYPDQQPPTMSSHTGCCSQEPASASQSEAFSGPEPWCNGRAGADGGAGNRGLVRISNGGACTPFFNTAWDMYKVKRSPSEVFDL